MCPTIMQSLHTLVMAPMPQIILYEVQECEGRGTLGTVPASLGQPELASEDFVLLLGFSLKIFIN